MPEAQHNDRILKLNYSKNSVFHYPPFWNQIKVEQIRRMKQFKQAVQLQQMNVSTTQLLMITSSSWSNEPLFMENVLEIQSPILNLK